ncbi:hypothetical protein BJ170DRAFT_197904 [Xylariales sp. AK1849]|nr:hypothetical protein BJ170DRAFT_197904 [Xylariales sp. AK1849]
MEFPSVLRLVASLCHSLGAAPSSDEPVLDLKIGVRPTRPHTNQKGNLCAKLRHNMLTSAAMYVLVLYTYSHPQAHRTLLCNRRSIIVKSSNRVLWTIHTHECASKASAFPVETLV